MKKTPKNPDRPLKQKTIDIYLDQDVFLTKLAKKMSVPVQYLIRAAIDQQYNLPKKKKNEV